MYLGYSLEIERCNRQGYRNIYAFYFGWSSVTALAQSEYYYRKYH